MPKHHREFDAGLTDIINDDGERILSDIYVPGSAFERDSHSGYEIFSNELPGGKLEFEKVNHSLLEPDTLANDWDRNIGYESNLQDLGAAANFSINSALDKAKGEALACTVIFLFLYQ